MVPVLGHKVHNALGVQAQEHQVPLRQGFDRVWLHPVHNVLLQGIAQGGLAHVHADQIKIFKSVEGLGHRAADQAQPHDDDMSAHNLFLFSPDPVRAGHREHFNTFTR